MMERQHVVIRVEDYVGGTREKPEVGVFTQTHAARKPAPWGRVEIGEVVWMKWSGGPMVAKARIQGFRQIENCTPGKLRNTTRGFKLYDLDEYWDSRDPVFFGMTIFLEHEEWLEQTFYSRGRSYGESWIIVDSLEKVEYWLTPTDQRESEARITQSDERGSRTISKSLRFMVLRRDDFACTYCGRKPPEVQLQIDHIVPWSSGGGTMMDNLRTACAECNIGKGARRL
jgi:hypothetical protein